MQLRNPLDYEKRTKYTFAVRASDGEFFALTRLEFHVLDVNDELPEFVSIPVRLVVQENQPPETYVGQVSESGKVCEMLATFFNLTLLYNS